MVKVLLWILQKFGYVIFFCLLTLIVELFVLLFFKNRKALRRPLIIANVITNPILNLILPAIYILCFNFVNFKAVYYVIYGILFVLEVLVVFAEAYIIRFFTNLNYKKCLKYSIVFNLVSFLLGCCLNNLGFLQFIIFLFI